MNIINFNTVDWYVNGVKQDRLASGIEGESTVFVINNKIVRIIGTDRWFSDLLMSADSFQEGQGKDDIFCVEIMNNGEKTLLICDEMLCAILLSDPIITKIEEHHKYKELVSVGWSYIDGEFVIPGEME
jgi:hypothetical protein